MALSIVLVAGTADVVGARDEAVAAAAEAKGDLASARRIYDDLAERYSEKRDLEQEITSRRKVLDLDRRLASINQLALGAAYRAKGDLGSAAVMLREAIRMQEDQPDEQWALAISHQLLGRTLVDRKTDSAEALRHFERSLALFTDLGDRSGMASAHYQIGRLERAVRRDRSTARFHLEQALALVGDEGGPKLVRSIREELAQVGGPNVR